MTQFLLTHPCHGTWPEKQLREEDHVILERRVSHLTKGQEAQEKWEVLSFSLYLLELSRETKPLGTYTCTYVHTYTRTHTHTHTHTTHSYMHTHSHTYTDRYLHLHTHI